MSRSRASRISGTLCPGCSSSATGVGIAGGGAIACGLAAVAARRWPVTLWTRSAAPLTARGHGLIGSSSAWARTTGAPDPGDDESRLSDRRAGCRRGDRRGARPEGRAPFAARRGRRSAGAAGHDDVVAVGRRAGRAVGSGWAPRRPARVQPRPADGPRRGGCPGRGARRRAATRVRVRRRAREDRGGGRRRVRGSWSTGCCSPTCATPCTCSSARERGPRISTGA